MVLVFQIKSVSEFWHLSLNHFESLIRVLLLVPVAEDIIIQNTAGTWTLNLKTWTEKDMCQSNGRVFEQLNAQCHINISLYLGKSVLYYAWTLHHYSTLLDTNRPIKTYGFLLVCLLLFTFTTLSRDAFHFRGDKLRSILLVYDPFPLEKM